VYQKEPKIVARIHVCHGERALPSWFKMLLDGGSTTHCHVKLRSPYRACTVHPTHRELTPMNSSQERTWIEGLDLLRLGDIVL